MMEKGIAVCLSVLILAQAWGVRRLAGTWLFPACLFGIFWFAMTFIPLVALLLVPIDPFSVGFILLCTVMFSAGCLLFNWKPAFRKNALRGGATSVFGGSFLKHAFQFTVAASLALIVLNTVTQGISWFDLVFNLFATAELYARLRYANDLASPLVERWSIVFTYLGVIIGGLRFGTVQPGGRKWIVAMCFVPSVLIALTQSAKWPFLLSLALFYAGILAYRISDGSLLLLGKGGRRTMVMNAVLVLLVIGLSFMSRGLYAAEESDVWPMVSNKLASYTSGHLYGFSDWFAFSIGRPSEWAYDRGAANHGFYTFTTFFRMLGSSAELPIGVYDDNYSYAGLIVSNVFTMFRGLIIDFGYLGALAFMGVIGVIFHGSFYLLLVGRRPVFGIVLFIFMLAFFFSSFVVSMLGSNIVYYVTFGLLWLTLYINHRLSPPHLRTVGRVP